jgi:hypothetical protein
MDRPHPTRLLAVLAAAWAFLFAAMSFYWAAGGMTGVETLGNEIERLARDREPGFVAEVWVTGVLKVLGGLLALALVRQWGPGFPRRVAEIAVLIVGIGLTLYGVANLVQHGLMEAGAVDVPDGLGPDAVTWHLALWDPWWILGGILFLAAGWSARRARAAQAKSSLAHPATSSGFSSTMK